MSVPRFLSAARCLSTLSRRGVLGNQPVAARRAMATIFFTRLALALHSHVAASALCVHLNVLIYQQPCQQNRYVHYICITQPQPAERNSPTSSLQAAARSDLAPLPAQLDLRHSQGHRLALLQTEVVQAYRWAVLRGSSWPILTTPRLPPTWLEAHVLCYVRCRLRVWAWFLFLGQWLSKTHSPSSLLLAVERTTALRAAAMLQSLMLFAASTMKHPGRHPEHANHRQQPR